MLCTATACSANPSQTAETTAAATTAAVTEPETTISTETVAANDAIREAIEGLEESAFSGVWYAEKDGKAIASYAAGTLNDGTPITQNTPMPVGSVSKQFCAAAIMLLQEDGKLSVEDTLDKYYPEYKEGSRISLHNMLSMRSGISNLDNTLSPEDFSMEHTDAENTKALLDWAFNHELVYEPGEVYDYSNTNFIILANIVEQVSGKTYIDFVRERVFEPLGMNHTGFIFELKDNPDWAKGFQCDPKELSPGIEPGFAKGAGDVISTAADMTRWMNALQSGEAVSAESYKAMTTDQSKSAYGYGLSLEMVDGIGHFGNIGHFFAADCFVPEEKLTFFCAVTSGDLESRFYSMMAVLE